MVETRSGLTVEPGSPSTPTLHGHRRAHTHGVHKLTDSQAFTLLALALLVTSLPCIITPKLAARVCFGSAADPPEDQHTHTLGLLACGLVAAASIAFALEECARRRTLHTFTADTLKAALVAFGAGNLLLQFYYPATLTAGAAVVSILAQVATIALPASQLLVAEEDRTRVWHDFRRLPRNLPRALTLRKFNLPAALFLMLTVIFPATGLAYFVFPKWTLYGAFSYAYGKSTYLLWKAVGASLMTILPAITYTLKDKAENDLLARPVSRTLSLGLMAASIGHLLVLGPILNHGHGGVLLPALVGTWSVSLLASMAGLAAPDAAAMVERLTEATRAE